MKRCLNHVEREPVPMRAFSIHDPFAPLLQQARIGREQGEINSPVLILTDSTAK